MTNKETIQRNIGLAFDFVNYLIDNKSELEKLPDNFTLEFLKRDLWKPAFGREKQEDIDK
jgi:hypothetical protein